VDLTSRVKSTKDLVLGGHVQFFHDLVQLHTQLQVLALKLLERQVFLVDQKPKVLRLILRLSDHCLPLELD
jgi:hypothetical protein